VLMELSDCLVVDWDGAVDWARCLFHIPAFVKDGSGSVVGPAVVVLAAVVFVDESPEGDVFVDLQGPFGSGP
jgi:hypothetical protein